MPSVPRSRRRHKSRGKSRHRSSHSTRPPSVAPPNNRNPRTSSIPPNFHNKTADEIKEDQEYVKRVLAYLETPGPAPFQRVPRDSEPVRTPAQHFLKTPKDLPRPPPRVDPLKSGAVSKRQTTDSQSNQTEVNITTLVVKENLGDIRPDEATMAQNDSISGLCALLAQMGATQTEDKSGLGKSSVIDQNSPKENEVKVLQSSNVAKVSAPITEVKSKSETSSEKENTKNKENIPKSTQKEMDKKEDEESKPGEKSKADLRKERRALQEAQRAAKQKATEEKKKTEEAETVPETKKTAAPTSKTATKKRTKTRTKKGSKIAIVAELRDPENEIDEPEYYKDVHPEFEKLTHSIRFGRINTNDSQSVAFMYAIYQLLNHYHASVNTDIERDIVTQIQPNLKYMKHFEVYTPSMQNIYRMFHANLHSFWSNASNIWRDPSQDDNQEAQWAVFIRETRVSLRQWILDFIKRNYTEGAVAIADKISAIFEDGDLVLVYGFCKPFIDAVERFCSSGKMLSVVVADKSTDGESFLTLSAISQIDLNGGYLRKGLLSDLANIIPKVQKVFVPCSHVTLTGGTIGDIGYAAVVAKARSHSVPVLGICFSYQFTDLQQMPVLIDNQLVPPEEHLWGRQPFTKLARPGASEKTTLTLTTNPSYKSLDRGISERGILRNFDRDNRLSGSSYSVCGRGKDFCRPLYSADVSCMSLKRDISDDNLHYVLSDMFSAKPSCTPSLTDRFQKSMQKLQGDAKLWEERRRELNNPPS